METTAVARKSEYFHQYSLALPGVALLCVDCAKSVPVNDQNSGIQAKDYKMPQQIKAHADAWAI
jgi:hypothetical protein